MRLLIFLLFMSTIAFGQNTQSENQTLINIVRYNPLTSAKVANALDALNGSKHGFYSYTASGTNTYTVSITGITSYISGVVFPITFTNANSSTTVTLNVNSIGAKALKANDGTDPEVGGIPAGGTFWVRYNGTNLRIVGSVGDSGGTGGTGDALTSNSLAQFAPTTSAELRGVLSDESGTGVSYFQGGALGTPSSGTGTNLTGIPLATGLSTFTSSDLAGRLTNESGTGVAAFTTSPSFTTPDLGTPSSVTLTNGTGLPINGITSTTSTQLATLLTNETGNGQSVFSVSPALTTPDLGVPSAATLTNATGLPLATGVTAFNSSALASKMSDELGSGVLYFGQPIEAHTTVTSDYTFISGNVSVYQNAGIVTVTGSSPVDLTFPASTFPALTKIIVNNQSSDTVTLHYAGGVTPNDGGYDQIYPHNSAVLFQRIVNTLDVLGTGPSGSGSGGGNCYTGITEYSASHTLDDSDITDCNHNGFIRFTPTTNITFSVPDDATLDVDDGTFIVLSNQSVDDTITVVFDGDITGGNHSYDEILPGETAVISNISTDVWDINGTKPVTGGGGGSGDALTSNPLSQFAATTSSQLRGVLSDEVGTGAFYTVGGALGTPASGTATNLTGLPLTTGVTGILPVANGGTGTASPGIVAGTNISVSGTWPNQTVNFSYPETIVQPTTDVTTTSASAADVTGLSVTLAASSTYYISGDLHIGMTANSSGIAIGFVGPSGWSGYLTIDATTTTATARSYGSYSADGIGGAYCTVVGQGRGKFGGTITTSSSGTFKVQFAVVSTTSSPTGTFYKAGTVLVVKKL